MLKQLTRGMSLKNVINPDSSYPNQTVEKSFNSIIDAGWGGGTVLSLPDVNCYGLSLSPPKIPMWKPNPLCDGMWRWGFGASGPS